MTVSSDPLTGLVALTRIGDTDEVVSSRVVTTEIAVRVGYLLLEIAAAASALGGRAGFFDLDEIILEADLGPGCEATGDGLGGDGPPSPPGRWNRGFSLTPASPSSQHPRPPSGRPPHPEPSAPPAVERGEAQ